MVEEIEAAPFEFPTRIARLEYIYIVFVVVGSLSNGAIVLATITNRHLRSSCNFLIALCCSLDVIHVCGHTITIYGIVSGNVLISSMECFVVQIPAVIGIHGGTFCILSIGIDRFCACVFPAWYSTKSTRMYLTAHVAAITAYCVGMLALNYGTLEDREVWCLVHGAIMGQARASWYMLSIAIYAASVIIYAFVFWRLSKSDQSDAMKVIFRSLTIILLTVVGGWMTTMFIGFSGFLVFGEDPPKIIAFGLVAGLFVNTSLCMNYAIYYTTSSEYRAALKKQLAWLFPRRFASMHKKSSSSTLASFRKPTISVITL